MADYSLKRPIGYCTICHRASWNLASIGSACDRMSTLRRANCGGVFQAAPAKSDWLMCPTCTATGLDGRSTCGQCLGDGWVFNAY